MQEDIANKLLDSWCRNKDDYCPHLKALEEKTSAMKKCFRGIVYMVESGISTKNSIAFARLIAEAKGLCGE